MKCYNYKLLIPNQHTMTIMVLLLNILCLPNLVHAEFITLPSLNAITYSDINSNGEVNVTYADTFSVDPDAKLPTDQLVAGDTLSLRVLIPPGTSQAGIFIQGGPWGGSAYGLFDSEPTSKIAASQLGTLLNDGANPTLYYGTALDTPRYRYFILGVQSGTGIVLRSMAFKFTIGNPKKYREWRNARSWVNSSIPFPNGCQVDDGICASSTPPTPTTGGLVVNVTGNGTVKVTTPTTSTIQSCTALLTDSASCRDSALEAGTVTLFATSSVTGAIITWGSDCIGSNNVGSVSITASNTATCTVTFTSPNTPTPPVVGSVSAPFFPLGVVGNPLTKPTDTITITGTVDNGLTSKALTQNMLIQSDEYVNINATIGADPNYTAVQIVVIAGWEDGNTHKMTDANGSWIPLSNTQKGIWQQRVNSPCIFNSPECSTAIWETWEGPKVNSDNSLSISPQFYQKPIILSSGKTYSVNIGAGRLLPPVGLNNSVLTDTNRQVHFFVGYAGIADSSYVYGIKGPVTLKIQDYIPLTPREILLEQAHGYSNTFGLQNPDTGEEIISCTPSDTQQKLVTIKLTAINNQGACSVERNGSATGSINITVMTNKGRTSQTLVRIVI